MMKSAGETRAKLATTLPGDPGYAALVAAEKSDAAGLIQLHSDMISEVYAQVLTPEQRAEAAKHLAERAQHEAGRGPVGGHWGERGADKGAQ